MYLRLYVKIFIKMCTQIEWEIKDVLAYFCFAPSVCAVHSQVSRVLMCCIIFDSTCLSEFISSSMVPELQRTCCKNQSTWAQHKQTVNMIFRYFRCLEHNFRKGFMCLLAIKKCNDLFLRSIYMTYCQVSHYFISLETKFYRVKSFPGEVINNHSFLLCTTCSILFFSLLLISKFILESSKTMTEEVRLATCKVHEKSV